MPGILDGKVAIVTGGSAGIGKATALAFARSGASVAVADVSVEKGESVVKEIKEMGANAIFIKTNVAQASEVESMVSETVKAFGRLDYACNNAGIEGASAATADSTEENWDKVINVNLKGVWLSMKYEITQMLKQGDGGSIVNLSSVAGLVGFEGMPAYCASKGGVAQLTKTAALEYAKKGIRVNAICPGGIRTEMVERIFVTTPGMEQALQEMHPIGRLGTADEVANAIIWLCSDYSSFVTGVLLPVDGGLVAR